MKKVRSYILENRILKDNDNVIVGLSGGADSVCLLHILKALQKDMNLSIHAIHINHMIRTTAKRDEDFSVSMCKALDIPVSVYSIKCKEIAEKNGVSIEEAGRNERYRLFNEAGKELFGDNYVIAIAHHKGDVAETMLFNLARGTGINGLASIKAVNTNIVRPLLCLTKEEIDKYLLDNKLEHVEDETNQCDDYSRNKIRHKIIPEMNSLVSNATDHIAQTAILLGEIEDYLSIETDKALELYLENTSRGLLIKNDILECHIAIRKRVIHKALILVASKARDISSVQIEAVMDLFSLQTGKKRNLIYGINALREYDGVCLSKSLDEEVDLSELKKISFNKTEYYSQLIPNELYTKWLDYDKIECPIARFKEQGDYIVINDRGDKQSLSDYMKNEKIPSAIRNQIPLVADGHHVLWLVGYRISADVKISDTTKNILVVNYSE